MAVPGRQLGLAREAFLRRREALEEGGRREACSWNRDGQQHSGTMRQGTPHFAEARAKKRGGALPHLHYIVIREGQLQRLQHAALQLQPHQHPAASRRGWAGEGLGMGVVGVAGASTARMLWKRGCSRLAREMCSAWAAAAPCPPA